MEALDHEKIKESRTEKLLRGLGVTKEGFMDEKLPSKVFSYSQYTAYKICGKAYEFKYIEKQEMPNYAPLVRGVAVHAGIEHMLRKKMVGGEGSLEEALAVAEDRFEEAAQTVVDWGPDEDETPTDPEKIKNQVREMIRVFAQEGYSKINPIGIEEGFAKLIGGVPMVGWIDLVDLQPAIDVTGMSAKDAVIAPKKTVIVDFKTTTKTWGAGQLRNNPQLTLYTAVKGTPHARIDMLVNTKKIKFVQAPTERTPDDVAVLTEDLQETTELIKKGVFAKTTIDNWCCNPKHCSWWDKCRGKKRSSP